ncbi:Asp-tRNA(Asn)/Glu-tRNA(Gln) amidotransferase subunit GatC [Desulfolucanica intricata]|uniref:Asp-tRNA(Asn)/Glu-tRNA(Gln) amidotransferase subunit GatC n=1 Tax=Desulfolucanica intricata TaxID=1285191 RepID=UPI000833D932|nr:Asp-tRNA(Asn)/Glu-tRNA(Gln) amidotransferase subunit GatC [Desulfolucanica intricata]
MITRAEVDHIALIARLKLSEEQQEKYTEQFNAILKYAELFQELDTKNVEPTFHVLPLQNVFREDKVGEHLTGEKVLANAPDSDGEYFKVPKIM